MLCFGVNIHSQEIHVTAKKIEHEDKESDELINSTLYAFELKENISIDTDSVGFSGITQVGIRGLGKGSISTFLDEVELTDSSDINSSSQLQYINFNLLRSYSLQDNDLGSNSFNNSLKLKTKRKNELNLMYGSDDTSLIALNLQMDSFINATLHISRLFSKGISKVKNQASNLEPEKDFFVSNNFFTRVEKKVSHFTPFVGFYIIDGKQDIDGFDSTTFLPKDLINNDTSIYKHYIFLLGTKYQKSKLHTYNLFYNMNTLNRVENDSNRYDYDSFSKRITFKQRHIFSRFFNLRVLSTYEQEKASILSDLYLRNRWFIGVSNKLVFPNFKLTPFLRVSYEKEHSFPFGINALYNWNDLISSNLKLTQSEKLPSLFQRYDSFSGNSDLKNEKLKKVSLKNTYKSPNLLISKDLFFYKMNNKISYQNNSYLNIAKSTNYGVELTSKLDIKNIVFNLGYRYLSATDSNKNQLATIPKHKGLISISKKLFNINTTFKAQYKSKTTSFSKNIVDAYALIDLEFSYKINPNFLASINFHNLFDHVYEDIEYYQTRGFSSYASISFTP